MKKHPEKSIKLVLYIAGKTTAAVRAFDNLEKICSELTENVKYEIKVVDILEHPQLAEDEKILATPTLIKELPEPIKRIVGDLSDKEQVLIGLNLIHIGI